MAYAFNAIDEIMDPSQQKQNIFASDNAQGAPSGANQQQGGVKTSTEGDLGTQESSGGSKQAPAPVADSSQADRAAVKANAGKSGQPAAISNVQSQLQSANQRLQDESSAYVQKGKAAQNYSLDTGSLQKAAEGNAEKGSSVAALLGRKTINPVDEFKPSDVNVSDANLLNTEAGLQNLVARGQGPQYTRGMAAFDTQSLRRNPEFSNLMKMIQNQQSDLQKQASANPDLRRKEVEDYGNAQLTQAQQAARGYLGNEASQIDAQNAAEAAKANQRLAGLRTTGVDKNSQVKLSLAKQAAQKAVQAQLAQNDPTAAGHVNSAKVDPNQFVKIRDNYSANDFVDANEALRFNNIAKLLGTGGVRSAALDRGKDYSLDTAGLQKAIMQGAQGIKGEKNKATQSQIQQIMEQANQAAETGNASRGYTASKAAEEDAMNALREAGIDTRVSPGVNAEDFTKYGEKLTPQTALNQAQVTQLNRAYQSMGDPTRVQYQDPGQAYNFDKSGYISAVQRIRDEQQQQEQREAEAAAQEQYDANPGSSSQSAEGAINDFAKSGLQQAAKVPGAIVGDIGRRVSQETKNALKKLGLRR